jgi:hypothetical protein
MWAMGPAFMHCRSPSKDTGSLIDAVDLHFEQARTYAAESNSLTFFTWHLSFLLEFKLFSISA